MAKIIQYSCLCMMLLMGTDAGALQIQLKKAVEVQGSTVRLGQIASISQDSLYTPLLKDMVVSRSLQAGSDIVLKSASIQSLVEKKSDDIEIEWGGSSQTSVSRSAIVVGQSDVKEILNGFLSTHQQYLPRADVRFKKIQPVKPLFLPVGQLDIEVIPSDPAILKSRSFALIFKVDGELVENITVRCTLEAIALVAVAAKDLRRGHIISENDVLESPVDLVSVKKQYVAVDELTGKRVRRSVKQGKLLFQSMVDIPPMIRRGELVTIAASKGSLMVTAKGIAQHNGREDEMIRVQNSSSRKEIFCRVKEPGLVTVVF